MIVQDLRYAVRQFRSAPGFAITVVLTLALSVGLATAVFCVLDAVILRPLPFVHPDRLAFVENVTRAGFEHPESWPDYKDQAVQLKTFQSLAGYLDFRKITIDTPTDGPVSLDAVRSTGNFFQIFGVPALLGRTFLPGEEQDGRNDIAVLSFGAWQKYFAADRSVIGRTVHLDGRSVQIVGVMPASFRYPLNLNNAVYTPRLITDSWMQNRGAHWLRVVGRLKDGVTLQQAQADLAATAANLARAYPGSNQDESSQMVPIVNRVDGKKRAPLWTLLFAVCALLAIGCVNVAGLLLARGVHREREMAMRVAIGAGRNRLFAQVLTESLMQAALGALSGVFVAYTLLQGMSAFLLHALDRGADVHMNGPVLAAAIAVAIVTSLGASLYPAARLAHIDPNRALKSGANAGTQRSQARLRAAFIVVQVALTLVLLVVAALLMRSVTRYRDADLGFNPSHLLTAKLDLSRTRYEGRDMLTAFYAPLEERVRNLPGVEAAGLINMLPIDSFGNNSYVHIAGQPPLTANSETLAETRYVSKGYFETMGVSLHRGRALSPALDGPDNKAGTVLVNDAFLSRFIPRGIDPLSARMDNDGGKEDEWTRIVGLTGNIRQSIYDQPMPERDWLMDEIPTKYKPDLMSEMFLVVRTKGDPNQVVPAIRSLVHDLDPTVPLDQPRSMNEVVSETLVLERMEAWLFGIFASLALALALVGLYGLVSHEVEQSTRDIGVRMALGATRSGILSMMMRRVALMLAAGSAAGLVLTFFAHKLIGMVIYFEAQKEVGGFLLLGVLLVAAGSLAALIPALRAASIEPMRALRAE